MVKMWALASVMVRAFARVIILRARVRAFVKKRIVCMQRSL